MMERQPQRLTGRWRRAATHVAAALNLRSPSMPPGLHEPPVPTRLGPIPFYGQAHYQNSQRMEASQPGRLGRLPADSGYYRMTNIITAHANPHDYGYPVGMHGFPPPDWMLQQWKESWDQEQASQSLNPVFLSPKD